ncbi:MAG: EamA family transporter [Vampirovibrionales bacterium]
MSLSTTVLTWCGVCNTAWSVFDATRKRLALALPIDTVLALLMGAQGVLFGAVWLWHNAPLPPALQAYVGPAAVSLLLNWVGNALFLQAVRQAPLSLCIPMLSLTPALAALFSQWWFHDSLTRQQWIGIGLVMAGMGWLAFPPQPKNAPSQGLAPGVLQGLGLMAICALCWAATPVVDKLAVQAGNSVFHSLVLCVGLWVIFSLMAWRQQQHRQPQLLHQIKQQGLWFAAAIVSAAVALYCQLEVTQHMNVGLFEALKRIMCLVASLALGRWWFNETITLHKLGVVGVLGLGMALVLL